MIAKFFEKDILKDKPFKLIAVMGIPLLFVQVLSIFSQMLSNHIFQRYVGEIYFSVYSVLSTLISSFTILSNVAVSVWIYASQYIKRDGQMDNHKILNGLFTVVALNFLFGILLIAFSSPLFNLLNVPKELHHVAKKFFVVYIFSYALYACSLSFVPFVVGRCDGGKILILNAVSFCSMPVASFILLGVCRFGETGAGGGYAVVGLTVLILAVSFLRKRGVLQNLKKQDFKIDFQAVRSVLALSSKIFLRGFLGLPISFVFAYACNTYVDINCLNATSAVLPFFNITSVIGSISTAFFPANFGVGKVERIKEMLKAELLVGTAMALVGFALLVSTAKVYYTGLFPDNPTVVGYGIKYALIYGLGGLALPVVQVFVYFFQSVGYPSISILEGVIESLGLLICALWIIPSFGEIGKLLNPSLSWWLASIQLLICYFILRKTIYKKCLENQNKVQENEDGEL